MAGLPTLNIKMSGKRALIDKAKANMLIIIGATSFVVIFSLVACRALFSQSSYQGRVVKAQDAALKQLKENNKNITSLVDSYTTFATGPVNILGGNPTGTGPVDGDNPKIVLDALPSKYDFPGLVSGVTKLLNQGGYKVTSIGGTDDEVAQQNSGTDQPAPVEIPLPITVSTSYGKAPDLLKNFERSIRPIYLDHLAITATSSDTLTVTLGAKTYYLPEKTLKIGSKVVK